MDISVQTRPGPESAVSELDPDSEEELLYRLKPQSYNPEHDF